MGLAGSDQDDGRAAGQLRAADARRLEPVLAAVEPKLAGIAPAAGMEGAVLCQHDRSAEPKRR